jgi:hypothetical protein
LFDRRTLVMTERASAEKYAAEIPIDILKINNAGHRF